MGFGPFLLVVARRRNPPVYDGRASLEFGAAGKGTMLENPPPAVKNHHGVK
jgi:hypothetical protein